MASPQLDDGYTRIANELLDAMIRSDLSKREMKVALCIIRMTYGYGRKSWTTNYQNIAERTGIDRRNVMRTIGSLVALSVVAKLATSNSVQVNVIKDYNKWGLVARIATGGQNDHRTGGQISHSTGGQNSHPYKEKEKLKEKLKESRTNSEPPEFKNVAYSICSDILERLPKFKQPNLETWAKHIRLMVERDNRTLEEIWKVWRWVNADTFWQANILSPAKLRDKFDTLTAHMARNKSNGNRLKLPADNDLESFAKSHGLSKPGKTQSYFDYRKTLEREIAHGGRL